MKPEEALEFLDQTVAQISGSRPFHVKLQQAIECLQNLIANVASKDEDGTTKT